MEVGGCGWSSSSRTSQMTLASCAYTPCAWAGGTYANYPDFCKNHQFHVIYCVTLPYVLYFEEFLTLDSRRFTIFEEWLTKSVGLVPFPAKYLICRHVRTDWRTDWWTDWRTDEFTFCQLRSEIACAPRSSSFYFKEFLIHNSRSWFLKNNWPNLLGLCLFPLNTWSAGMYRRTDGLTN